MSEKEIINDMSSFDRNIVIGLSLLVLIASFVGLFLLTGSSGITGFSVFEATQINGVSIGFILFVALCLVILITLVNLALLGRRKK